MYDRKTKKLYSVNDNNGESFRRLVHQRPRDICNGSLNTLEEDGNGDIESPYRCNGNVEYGRQESNLLGHHSARRKTRHEINIELRRKSAEKICFDQPTSDQKPPDRPKCSSCFGHCVRKCFSSNNNTETENSVKLEHENTNGNVDMNNHSSVNNITRSNSHNHIVPWSCLAYSNNSSDILNSRSGRDCSIETIAVDLTNESYDENSRTNFYLDTSNNVEITYF